MTRQSHPEQPPPETKNDTAAGAKPGVMALIIHHSITVVILILVLVLVVWGYLNFQDADFFATVDRDEFDAQLHPPLEQAQAQRIETSLHVYSLVYSNHPPHLENLVETGLLVSSDLYYPRGSNSWTYQRHGDGYTLDPTSDDNSR